MRRVLIVGAGASIAEAVELGLPKENFPPTMLNFARALWGDFNPYPVLDRFLESLGYKVEGQDGRELFYYLESEGVTNIERFYEFAWRHRDKIPNPSEVLSLNNNNYPRDYFYGGVITSAGGNSVSIGGSLTPWENLIYNGMGKPLQELLLEGFHENGLGIKPLLAGQSVAKWLRSGDIVLNLNYDPLFEISLTQGKHKFNYCFDQISSGGISVFKPHGSLNLAVRDDGKAYQFGGPEGISPLPPRGWKMYVSLMPPRFNKSFSDSLLAKVISDALLKIEPTELAFWGIGLTDSDSDLLDLYRAWGRSAKKITVINPDLHIGKKFNRLIYVDVEQFSTHQDWLPTQT